MKQKPSVFNTHTRIRRSQLEWIKQHLGGRKTVAGRLDEIINHFKRLVEHESIIPLVIPQSHQTSRVTPRVITYTSDQAKHQTRSL